MSAAVEVRPALDDELPRVGELTAAAYLADGLLPADHSYVEELRDATDRARRATVLVAVDPGVAGAGAVVGTITLADAGTPYAEFATGDEVELRMLAVDPAARGRGVAEQLVRAALADAVGRGRRDVVLCTLDTMRAAHRLYARLGFTPRPERDWGTEVDLRVHAWRAPEPPGVLVETATWPPLRVEDVQGWRVGLSRGVTRRGHSTVPLAEPADLAAAVDEVERLSAADGAPAVFRTGDPGTPAGLVAELDARGYAVGSLTDVLVRDVGSDAAERGQPRTAHGLRVLDAPDDAWLTAWLAGKGGDREVSRALVAGAPATYLAAPGPDGSDVAVIRAATVDGWVALSCLQVAPSARRHGLGRTLTDAALAVAARQGARRAFLQVEAENVPARRLYEQLGFALAHRYAYRVQPSPGAVPGSC